MNCLSIDYGSKRIGLAYSQDGFIFTLPAINNDTSTFTKLKSIISQYSINQIFVGLSEGDFAIKTKKFISILKEKIILPIETVEEAISTIEADSIFKKNKKNSKKYKENIDSISAAIILRRAISL